VDIYIEPGMAESLRNAIAYEELAMANLEDALAWTKPASSVPAGAIVVGRVNGTGTVATVWTQILMATQTKARALGGDGLVASRWEYFIDGESQCKRVEFAVVRYAE